MPFQRACGAGKQAGHRLSNGPRRVWGNGAARSIRNVGAYVSCRGYVGIFAKCMGKPMNQGGTADEWYTM